MPTNLNTLLAPISETSPCGEDLLFSADFDAIQHARRFEDPSLDQGEWVTDIKEADWPFVVERSSSLLQTQTKDLRLAVWLTEALAIEEGVSGLTQGYALLTGLCEKYWDHVHPLPEGDDTEYRLGNVAWLVGRTGDLLRATPLTSSQGRSYSTIDWDVATHVAQAVKRDPDHADDIARGKPSIEQIEASKRRCSRSNRHWTNARPIRHRASGRRKMRMRASTGWRNALPANWASALMRRRRKRRSRKNTSVPSLLSRLHRNARNPC